MSRYPSQLTRPKVGLLAVLTFACASGASAQSGDADWQMYAGGSNFAGTGMFDKAHGDNLLFFDAAGVVRRSDGHIEVWIKALPWNEVKAQPKGDQMTKKFIDFSQRKLANGYMPPLSTVTELDVKERAFVMMFEAAANLAGIKPTVQMLMELDCTARVTRVLSIHALNYQPDDTVSAWMHEPPGTSGATLIKILCK